MYSCYLITGATGNLGREIVRMLLDRGDRVRALIMPGDDAERELPEGVKVVHGDVTDRDSLRPFFEGALSDACLVHCAGVITIASKAPPSLWRVNVEGTRNILSLCREREVGRVIYVSSVHAIPELAKGKTMREIECFSPDLVQGHYAKSKAAATSLGLKAAHEGMNLSVVHPSGILCPGDGGRGNTSAVILSYCQGRLPFATHRGYDFVDVRDVALGILACAAKGRGRECFILSGYYATLEDILGHVRRKTNGRRVTYLPLPCVRLLAPAIERICILRKQTLFLTPYSVFTLGSNAVFSHEKATQEFGYRPRELDATLDDVLSGLEVRASVRQAVKKRCPWAIKKARLPF